MARVEMKASDLCELYILLEMYVQTYGTAEAEKLTAEVKEKCREQGIKEIRNARSAGRKKTIPLKTDQQIMDLRNTGMSIRDIAAKTGVSRGYVHKLINGHNERDA